MDRNNRCRPKANAVPKGKTIFLPAGRGRCLVDEDVVVLKIDVKCD